MLAPIDFIREKYIKPNGITQDMLCDYLDIGKKTISELYQHKRGFTIHTAKKFALFFNLKPEFILLKQIEYDLGLCKKNYDFIKPFKKVLLSNRRENIAKWILSIINNSISDKKSHYTLQDLQDLFKNASVKKKYHYAIIAVFKEVSYEDMIRYCELYSIKKSKIKKLYEFYKNSFKAKEIKEYEWLFEEF